MLRLFNPANHKARDALILIVVFTLIKLAVAAIFPATIDEAYAIVVSRQWSLSNFDHPPLGFTISRVMAWLTGTEAVFFARLPFILMGAASAWFVYLISKQIYDETSAIWALIWFLIAPFFFISAGHFVVPDGPLNLALLLSFHSLLPLLLKQHLSSHWRPWLGFGLFLAIALLAKYQAVLFGLSILIFLATTPFGRSQLATIPPWIAAGICVFGLLPVLIWNTQNDFISFSFHSARAGNGTGLQPLNFFITMLGQAVYLLPMTFFLALGLSAKHLRKSESPAETALSWLVLIPFTIFALIALVSAKSLPHWPMSGFLFAFPLIGHWCAKNTPRLQKLLTKTANLFALGLTVLAVSVGLQFNFSALTRPFTSEKTFLDASWTDGPINSIAKNPEITGKIKFVFVRNWARGAKLGYALGPQVEITPLIDPRHFQFQTKHQTELQYLIDFITPDQMERAQEIMAAIATDYGLKIVGDTTILAEKAGNIVRFYSAIVPVEQN